MMRSIERRMLLTLGTILLLGARPPNSLEPPNWMAGAWIDSAPNGWTEEYWTRVRGGLMMGSSRSGAGDKLQLWEFMRIVQDEEGKLTFLASPNGKGWNSFPGIKSTPTMIEFANPGHDFPQRILYWRDGADLRARISLMDGSEAYEWHFKAMGGS